MTRPSDSRGYFIDQLTQRWVQATGRKIDIAREIWLNGPVGNPQGIGREFFENYAAARRLEIAQQQGVGLLSDIDQLELQSPVAPPVREFYERTSDFELDAWSEWCGAFRPFGVALSALFSRRLQH